MRIDQLIPAYHQGDAIGDTATHMRRFLTDQGYESHIYCLDRDPDLEENSRLFEEFPAPGPQDLTILHFALPSPLSRAFADLRSRKILLYHNITPDFFFAPYSREMARIARLGRDELRSLAPVADMGWADSEYNRKELESFGFSRTAELPLFIDFSKYKKPPSRLVQDLFRDSRLNILFVGRIVPNKRIDELIKVVFYYKKYISSLVRLIIVGKTESLPKYYSALVRLADEFYLKPEEICFTGHIPDEELFALYKSSDLFLSLSEHEGFGLPFIESMVFDLPILAYGCTAVPGTLGGAGVLFGRKPIGLVAELAHAVAGDDELKKRIVREQRVRLLAYQEQDLAQILLKNLATLQRGND
jgi:glycosyltransferase involved in cell wall biosynthesis